MEKNAVGLKRSVLKFGETLYRNTVYSLSMETKTDVKKEKVTGKIDNN